MTLNEAINALRDAGIESPEFDARELFIHFGKMSLAELISNDASCDSAELENAIERRKSRTICRSNQAAEERLPCEEYS